MLASLSIDDVDVAVDIAIENQISLWRKGRLSLIGEITPWSLKLWIGMIVIASVVIDAGELCILWPI